MGKKKKKITRTYSPRTYRICSVLLRFIAVIWFVALGIPTFILGYAGFCFFVLLTAMFFWMMGSACSKESKKYVQKNGK